MSFSTLAPKLKYARKTAKQDESLWIALGGRSISQKLQEWYPLKYTDKGGLVRAGQTNNESEQENLFIDTQGIALANLIKSKGILQATNML